MLKMDQNKKIFKWEIGNFLNIDSNVPLYSNTFTVDGFDDVNWCLKCYPSGDRNGQDYVSVYLCSKQDINVLGKQQIFIVLTDGTLEPPYEEEEEAQAQAQAQAETEQNDSDFVTVEGDNLIINFEEEEDDDYAALYNSKNGSGYSKFIKRQKIIDNQEKYLSSSNGSLAFQVELELIAVYYNDDLHQEKNNFKKSSLNIEWLFDNEQFSDVTLKVDGKSIAAHKNILASASPVFSAMFSHQMKENNENEVWINDIDYDIVYELARFIYFGKVNQMDQCTDQLLIVANKYQMENLKMICSFMLTKKLTLRNCIDYLILADLHGTKLFKLKAIEFINKNKKKINNTKLISLPSRLILKLFKYETN